jgi:hypothetical protein
MKQQDITRIAAVINAIYSNSQGELIGVKEFPLSPIFKQQKFYPNEQVPIMDYLKEHLIYVTGERAGMKYKWKGDMPDAEKIAQDIIDFYAANKKDKPKIAKVKKMVVAVVDKPERKATRFVDKVAGDMGYIFYMDRIYHAYICKVSKFPNQKPSYEVLITYSGKNCMVTNVPIFPSIQILCDFLAKTNHTFNMNAPLEDHIEEHFLEELAEVPTGEVIDEHVVSNL